MSSSSSSSSSEFAKFAKSSGVMGENQDGDPRFDELEAKFGPGGESDVEKAKAEWVARGYPAKTFTMAKMARLWEEDDENEMQRANDMGVSRLVEKDDMLRLAEERKLGTRISKAIKDNNAKLAKESSAWFKKTWAAVKDTLTPDAVKRQQEFKEYERAVAEQQASVKAADAKRAEIFARLEAQKRAEDEIAHARRVRLRRREPDDIKRRNALKAYNAQVAAARKKEEAARRRHRLLRAHEERAEEAVAAEAVEETQQRRTEQVAHWSRVAEDQTAAAQAYNAELQARREARQQQDVEDNLAEIARHEQRLHEQQFPTVAVSDDAPSNGIFGVPMTKGAYFNPEYDVEDEPGATEVNLSVGVTQGVDYHEDLARLQKLQSELTRSREEHSVLQAKVNANSEKIRTNEELGGVLSNEMRDIELTEAAFRRGLIGPPGRQPSQKDKEASHHRKRRKFDLHRQQLTLAREIAQRRRDSEHVAAHKARLEVHLRALTETTTALQRKLQREDQRRPELPMVVGRALDVPPFMRSPAKSLGAVRLETKIAVAKEAADGVFDVYRQSQRAAHTQWQLKQRHQVVADTVVRTVAKKRDVETRLAALAAKDNRARVVVAIGKFFAAGGTGLLKPPKGRGKMPLAWLQWRQKSGCVEAWAGAARNPNAVGGVVLSPPPPTTAATTTAAAAAAEPTDKKATAAAEVSTAAAATTEEEAAQQRAAVVMQSLGRLCLVRAQQRQRVEDFVLRKVRQAKKEVRDMAEHLDQAVLDQQAQLAWAWDHDRVRTATVQRQTPADPLGVDVELPQQIDLVCVRPLPGPLPPTTV